MNRIIIVAASLLCTSAYANERSPIGSDQEMQRNGIVCLICSTAVASTLDRQPLAEADCSPDPAVSPDGYGQIVGEAGETNDGCEEETEVSDEEIEKSLDAIENDPIILEQAKREADIPLEVFGGE